ncbi:MAG: hypothetical protein AAF985_22935 [Bacteroidota bacterium]
MKKIRSFVAFSSLILLAVCGYSAQTYAQSSVSTSINCGSNYFDVTLKNQSSVTVDVVMGIVDQDNLTHRTIPVTVPPNDETNVRILWDFSSLGMPSVQILSEGTASIDGRNNSYNGSSDDRIALVFDKIFTGGIIGLKNLVTLSLG